MSMFRAGYTLTLMRAVCTGANTRELMDSHICTEDRAGLKERLLNLHAGARLSAASYALEWLQKPSQS